jgi:DNA (cytosine-5)-methyltransferase 1
MSDDKKYRTIDLFAGLGGIRLGFDETDRTTNVWSNEIDKYACKAYEAYWGESPEGDITKVNPKEVPDHDILLAGFPCQSFSIAGGKLGFEDTRGTLFFYIAKILKEKQPRAFLLENVKHLFHHDKGKTFEVICNTLKQDLGYKVVKAEILNSMDFGVPQKRQRVYIVGFKDEVLFDFPRGRPTDKRISNILEKGPIPEKFFISEGYYDSLKSHRKKHQEKGNGFGFEIKKPDDIANTIVIGGMGKERNLIIDNNKPLKSDGKTFKKTPPNKEGVRVMTPTEWGRLQGYPEDYIKKLAEIGISDTQQYKLFANSVSVPVINAIAKQMIKVLDSY